MAGPVLQPDRDRGLVRAVGTWTFAASLINGVVGAGIFSLPASMAALAGAWSPLALLVCAIASGAVVLCAAEASGRVSTSGGAYGYADAAFGPIAAFVTGALVWVSSVLACGGIAAALVDGLGHSIPMLASPAARAGLIVAVIGGMAWINIIGVDPATRFMGILTVIKLMPLFILVLVGGAVVLLGEGGAPLEARPPMDFGAALILALFAFSGMETPLSASGEVADPARTIPRALFIGAIFVAILYIAIQLVCQGLLGPELVNSATPLADAMGRVSPALGVLLLAGASFSRFVWIGSDILGAPRVLFAFARDGTLPGWLAGVHPRSHAPHVAIIVHSLIAIALAVTGTFETLAILSGLATAGIYIMICVSAWKLRRMGVTAHEGAARYAILPYAAGLGLLAMIVIIALASVRDMIGLAILVVVSAAWALFRVKR